MIQAILIFFTEILKFIGNKFTMPSRQVNRIINIYDSMHRIIADSSVERITILKAHNSGGWIKPDTPLYISILYEDYTHPLESIKGFYQRMEIDEEYLRMLRDLIKEKVLKMDIPKLKPGILKSKYERDKIKQAEIYYLGQDRRNVYFCSLVSTQNKTFDSYVDRNVIDIGVSIIKNNIR